MVNEVELIGRLGQDPELRYTEGGSAVVNLSIATSESYTNNDGERIEKTEWHRVVVWDRQAETVDEYLGSGDLVRIVGQLQTRKWEDDSGNERYTTEIRARRVQFFPKGMSESAPQEQAQSSGESDDFTPDDELPF